MILKLYKQLEDVANNEYGDIIENVEIIHSHAGRARKLRLELIDSTYIDIFYSAENNYSFHWEQKNVRNSIYRHDNAPHKKWSNIKTFPKHCHDGDQDNVIESQPSRQSRYSTKSLFVICQKEDNRTKTQMKFYADLSYLSHLRSSLCRRAE